MRAWAIGLGFACIATSALAGDNLGFRFFSADNPLLEALREAPAAIVQAVPTPRPAPAPSSRRSLDAAIAHHARINNVPESLVRRVITRESRYDPRALHRGNYGLMQIKLATARSLGYDGPASGLLDAETNLTYAVRYLAGAYRVAGGDERLAMAYYQRGYYYAAKRAGLHRSIFGAYAKKRRARSANATW